jgi:hypothetical protein
MTTMMKNHHHRVGALPMLVSTVIPKKLLYHRHVANAKTTVLSIVVDIMPRHIGPPIGSNAGRAILFHLHKALCRY